MRTRILVAIPIAIVVLLAMFVQGWVLALFAVALSLLAQFEVMRALGRAEDSPSWIVSMTYATVLAILFLCDFARPASDSAYLLGSELILYLLIFAAMAAFAVAMLGRSSTFGSATATVFSLVYPALFMEFFYLIILGTKGCFVPSASYVQTLLALLILFVPPICSDTVAYFWGSKFGKVHIAPVVSPKKTLEGSIAGIIGGAVGALIVYLVGASICASTAYTMLGNAFLYILMGAMLALISQFGDLAASYLKRAVGIKDFGRLLPGHGGVMDRIDSTMFVMPLVYMFLSLQWVGISF